MIVVAGDYGQLGNRLIVFANMIAGAREYGWRVANPAFHPYAHHFESTRRDLWCRYPLLHRAVHQAQRHARKLRNRLGDWPFLPNVLDIGWREPCDLDGPEFRALARRPGVLFAKGWLFRAQTTFPHHADEIRRFFTPIESHRDNVAALMNDIRRTADIVVGVHIRHGDYRNYLEGRFHYEPGQYAALMRRTSDLLPGRRVAFLVCSNATDAPLAFGSLSVTPGTGHVIEDMHALAACDYVLGPPSTYSMWASFHGQVPLYVVVDPDREFWLDDFEVVRDFRRTTRSYVSPAAPERGSDVTVCTMNSEPAGSPV